ncbi:MAG: hypothetical protein ACYDA8_22070, partial [Deferrisomatales bacterium]
MTRPLGPIAALLLLLAAPAAAAGPESPARDFEARLQAAVARGEVTPDQAHLHRLAAVVDAARLPGFLRRDDGAHPRPGAEAGLAPPLTHRCGTLAARAVRTRLRQLPAGLRAEAEELLGGRRPHAQRAVVRSAGKTVTHSLPNWIETENFSIEWGPELTNEDGTNPVRDDGPAFAGDPAVG